MIVVFIAGGSCSGKTTFTKQMSQILGEQEISCIDIKMDDYYKEIHCGIDIELYKKNTNFDDPHSLDLELLQRHILL